MVQSQETPRKQLSGDLTELHLRIFWTSHSTWSRLTGFGWQGSVGEVVLRGLTRWPFWTWHWFSTGRPILRLVPSPTAFPFPFLPVPARGTVRRHKEQRIGLSSTFRRHLEWACANASSRQFGPRIHAHHGPEVIQGQVANEGRQGWIGHAIGQETKVGQDRNATMEEMGTDSKYSAARCKRWRIARRGKLRVTERRINQ